MGVLSSAEVDGGEEAKVAPGDEEEAPDEVGPLDRRRGADGVVEVAPDREIVEGRPRDEEDRADHEARRDPIGHRVAPPVARRVPLRGGEPRIQEAGGVLGALHRRLAPHCRVAARGSRGTLRRSRRPTEAPRTVPVPVVRAHVAPRPEPEARELLRRRLRRHPGVVVDELGLPLHDVRDVARLGLRRRRRRQHLVETLQATHRRRRPRLPGPRLRRRVPLRLLHRPRTCLLHRALAGRAASLPRRNATCGQRNL
mmetsp:Transcript_27231/g.88007  ORF Transcript_27231/g.88007 Transcript_27231/m.88007 type:complete len:255 (+) Transcript_27231:2380-3144(+)